MEIITEAGPGSGEGGFCPLIEWAACFSKPVNHISQHSPLCILMTATVSFVICSAHLSASSRVHSHVSPHAVSFAAMWLRSAHLRTRTRHQNRQGQDVTAASHIKRIKLPRLHRAAHYLLWSFWCPQSSGGVGLSHAVFLLHTVRPADPWIMQNSTQPEKKPWSVSRSCSAVKLRCLKIIFTKLGSFRW